VAYSESFRGSERLSYYDIKSGNDKSLQVATFSDKCVWANTDNSTIYCAVPKNIPSGIYPDSWYQGISSFTDNFWKINVDTGTTNLIYETGKNDTADVDAMNLRISPDDKYLVFTNKDDLSLWGLKIQ
jgi:Tol biopolymer transport system component